MSYQWFIGIDVSKQTLDITILNNNEKKMYEQIVNSDQSIKTFLKKLVRDQKILLHDCLFCLEHTGFYNSHFLKVMEEKKLAVCLESSVQIKQSGGLLRGKNDKVDSYRIALYAFKNKEFLTLWQPERTVIRHLKRLSGIRERLLNARKQINNTIKEDKKFIDKESSAQMMSVANKVSKLLRKTLKKQKEDKKSN